MRDVLYMVAVSLFSFFSPPLLSPVASEYHPVLPVEIQIVQPDESIAGREAVAPIPTPHPFESLQEQIEVILADYPKTRISVVVRSLAAGEHISINGDVVMKAASTTKLLTALLYFDRVERGEKRPDENVGSYPASYQLEQMIRQSNNDSWDLFIASVGLSAHNRYAREIGLRNYEAKDNTMTAEDMAVILTHIHQQDILSAEYMELLRSFMQDTNEERFIPPSVPKSAAVYHKTGVLEEFVHDGAVINDGKQPFILVIFTEHPSLDYDARAVIFGRITRAAVDTLIL